MIPRYNEEKATQAAAHILRLRGGKMAYLKLLKLLYFADRTALIELGRPITFDKYVSMDNGPVLSHTCNLIRDKPVKNSSGYWREHIKTTDVDAQLTKDSGNDRLSPAEEEILDRVFKQFGQMWRWDVVRESHALPEYRDPQGSALPIRYRDILLNSGFSPEEADAVEADLAAEDAFQSIAH